MATGPYLGRAAPFSPAMCGSSDCQCDVEWSRRALPIKLGLTGMDTGNLDEDVDTICDNADEQQSELGGTCHSEREDQSG